MKAVLWDMDGTLVDTEPYWIDTEYALAEKYGGTWSHEHAMNLVGSALLDSGDYIRVHMGIDRTPQQIVDELLDGVVARVEEEVPWRPGARELLDRPARERHPVRAGDDVVAALRRPDPARGCPTGTFASVVTGDRVEFGKPHPEPYLTAAAELGARARGLRGHRGLQHRRQVGRRSRVHRAVRARTTCRSWRGRGGSSRRPSPASTRPVCTAGRGARRG